MATPPGVFVQLNSNTNFSLSQTLPQYAGFQCMSSQNQCVPVTSSTYDTNFPLYGSIRECQMVCGEMYSVGSCCGGDLDVDTGPKKAPKIFG